ncbi:MAG: PP0621 family protein [Burkholderiales bacterium]
MGKVLFLLIVGLVFYVGWKLAARAAGARRNPAAPREAERMVACRQCGVHLPISESVEAGGDRFCSDEHKRMFVR